MRKLHRLIPAVLVLLFCLDVVSAQAQYFGRNKVQYRTFDFQVLTTEHFEVYYYPEEAEVARRVARMAERWYARLSQVLNHELRGPQPLILYASQSHFQQTNVVESLLGEGTGGVTESLRRRIVMPVANGLRETDHVLGHELVHAFQYDVLGPNAAQPLWFIEGMAEYLSLGSSDSQTAVWLRDAALVEELPTLSSLGNPRYFPYRFGHAFWAYVAQRWGDDAIAEILAVLAPMPGSRGGGDPVPVIERVLGIDAETFSEEWQQSIIATMLPRVSQRPAVAGRELIAASDDQAVNVGPVLSPDGRRIAFLSSRNRLSIELVVADAQTGRVERTLTETAVDPHFDSLQFLESAGTWSPAGDRIAIAALRGGRPVIAVYDVGSGDRVRELALDGLDEAVQPAWSPDGTTIVISGLAGGTSDLYTVAIESGTLRRLTTDIHSELQPAWSPDGRQIVFVTDRFSSNLEALEFGPYEPAILTLSDGAVARVAAFAGATHVSPQWTRSGLYFVANPDGVPDIYRLAPDATRLERLTRTATGVIGITESTPVLATARDSTLLSFVHYRDGSYEIRALDTATAAAEASPTSVTMSAAHLAPARPTPTAVDRLRAAAGSGLPRAPLADPEPYRASLGLDYVGQEFGVSAGGLGAYLGGGVALRFSDMLGRHVLETVAQINGGFEDFGGRASYLNRRLRWNWGGAVQWVPYVTGFYTSGVGDVDGEPALVEERVLDRQTDRQILGVAEYPFSRHLRVEFGGGVRHLTFEREVRTRAFDPQTGTLITDDESSRNLADPVTLGQASVALVRDTALFGATSPILGHRSRVEVSPSVGDLGFTTVVLDARHYVMPFRPVTIAVRGLHLGRYGGDAEAHVLSPLYLGFPNLVRGYDIGSFSIEDCGPIAGACQNFDQLIGSRLLVANLEVRAPLVGLFKGELDYGGVPVDLIGFFDAGLAWTRDTDPRLFGSGDRPWVRSLGFGARVNAFGYLIMEFDAVRPLDRIRNGWQFVFGITPGF